MKHRKIFIAVVIMFLFGSVVPAFSVYPPFMQTEEQKKQFERQINKLQQDLEALEKMQKLESQNNSLNQKFKGLGGGINSSNNAQKPAPAKNSNYDLPDFFALTNDGNLSFAEKRHLKSLNTDTVEHQVYSYECPSNKYNNYVERYLQQLNSYPFRLSVHYVQDYRNVAHVTSMLEHETWVFSYNGSKRVKNFRAVNFQDIKNDHIAPFIIRKGIYHNEGVVKISLHIADGLKYDDRSTANLEQRQNTGNSGSSYNQLNPPTLNGTKPVYRCYKCNGTGKVTCGWCNGAGETYEYVSVTNYSGSSNVHRKRVSHRCNKCNGTGKLECPACGGKGYTNK